MALINAAAQISLYAYNMNQIIRNYDAELMANNYNQYLVHHVLYLNYVIFHCLAAGITAWASIHISIYLIKRSFELCYAQLLESGASQYLPSWIRAACTKACRIDFFVSIFLVIVVEIILLALYVLECRLLVDMSVHLIDLDLVEILGIKQVPHPTFPAYSYSLFLQSCYSFAGSTATKGTWGRP